MYLGDIIAERYRVDRLAYEGGMGVVYLCHDLHSGEAVGIKILRSDSDPGSSQRFWREAHALSSLRHPGIVRYFAHGWTASGRPYLVMEWLEGEDLAVRLRRRALDVIDTLRVGIRVCDAVSSAHRHGIVHRDIKPANLFVPGGRIDEVTLVDFGLARVGQTLQSATPSGSLMGTPGFMAPEQARSDPNLDHRADIYSIGASLFACLVQRPPFVGDHPMATLAKVLFEEPPRLRELRPEVPQGLDDLIACMIAKEPEDRPADGGEVVTRLVELLEHLGAAAPVTQEPSPAITGGEQHFLTVLLVQGATVPGRARHAALTRAAGTYGAQLEEMVGGTIAGIFSERGRPVEMAERAARCALSMQSELGGGPVVLATGRGITSGRLPVGQVIDHAVSLFLGDADTLPPGATVATESPSDGDIIMDDVTAGLLDRSFALAPLGPRRYRLLGINDERTRAPRLLGIPTQCVGRQRELATLEGLLDECLEEESARVALVTGPAGVGKSRIRTEFLQRIEHRYREVSVWLGRGDWLRSGASCGLLAELVRDAVHLAEGQPLAERQARILERAGEVVRAEDAERVAVFLGEIVNVPFEDEGRVQLTVARQDHQLMHDQMRRAFIDWLGAELLRTPVLIVLDDLHWGDLPTLRFLDAALRALRERPFMVLALAQPQVHKLFPNLFEDRGVEELRLRPLSKRASRSLIGQVLEVPDDVVARIVERSEGNAFFLEELIRSVADGSHDELPQTVLALAEGRLATLPADARRVLRAAAIFGRTFWHEGVAALLGNAIGSTALDDILADLVEREFIADRPTSRFAHTHEYRFAGELTREVAYGTLTEEDRAHGHVRAGGWLEAAGEPEPAVLAEHFRRGGARARAVEWYRRAAEEAMEANDDKAVAEWVTQAVNCGAQGRALGELRLLEAEMHNWQGEPAAARRCSDEAMALLPTGSASWAQAVQHASWAACVIGGFEEVDGLVDMLVRYASEASEGTYLRALAHMATQLAVNGRYEQARTLESIISEALPRTEDEQAVRATLTHMRGILAFMADELDRACDLMREAAQHWGALGSQRYRLLDLSNAGAAQLELGEYEAAAETLRPVVAGVERAGLDHIMGICVANLALALALSGRTEEAVQICDDSLASVSSPREEVVLLVHRARILDLTGDHDGALANAERARAMETFPSYVAHALAIKASVHLQRGLAEEAFAAAAQGMAILDERGAIESGEGILRLAYAEALHALGRLPAAREAIEAAAARLHGRAARISDPQRRRRFLDGVPEHARTMQLEREWSSARITSEPGRGGVA
ncbi:serine/threonine-protein kinase PknK [Haliangium sp.]|uniref:serine/threonine-protein kinase n=1 Tax=Haliangium sp. TaxID=2663208 RepID=UPI003D0989EE